MPRSPSSSASGSESRRRTAVLQARFTAAEAADIRARAERAGTSVGSLIRAAVLAAEPVRATRRPTVNHAQVARVLANEGFIEGFVEDAKGPQGTLKVFLKYDASNRGTIRGIRRVSRPSRRVYVAKGEIPRVRNGLGIAILTTPRGVLTDAQARKAGVGGEVICHVW